MIPIRLELKNFLPYRAPEPLRFEGIHLACLTGPNGAGKSSLLDAITWALWGNARAKVQDDLIHLGADHMFVQLDFEQEGATWRVIRRRTSGKRGQSTLDLLMLKPDGTWRNDSENHINETQRKINDLLRLDYKTFVHSAFLQQGKADAFMTLTPAERKKVLADILGLDRWADYEQVVKERLKDLLRQIYNCEGAISEIEREEATRPQREAERAAARQAYDTACEARQVAESLAKEIEDAPADLRNAQANYRQMDARLKASEGELDQLDQQIDTQKALHDEHSAILAQREEIERGYAALKAARESDQSFNDKFRALKSLDERRYDLQKQIDAARARLDGDIAGLEEQIKDLQAQAEQDLSADLDHVQAELSALETREAERHLLDEENKRKGEELAGLKARDEQLTAEGKAVRDRLDRLDAAEGDPVCPLCGQPLDADHRAQIVAELEAEIAARREDYRQNRERIDLLSSSIKQEQQTLRDMARELKRLPALSERAGTLRAQVEAQQQAAERLVETREKLTALHTTRDHDDFAHEARAGLLELAQEEAALGYDAASHQDSLAQINSYSGYEEAITRLAIAETAIKSVEAELNDKNARRQRLLAAIEAAQAELATARDDIMRLGEKVEEYKRRQEALNQQRTREQAAYGRLTNADQALEALDHLVERKATLLRQRDELRDQESLYEDLKHAFGKNGIPAMMIDAAAPELETEANALLSRMTDGRMHLRISTQREKATGGTVESLTLEIADELGTRSYELYSGGEAFRINFAVRVALSKMLARRAGAHLRTLFIDEGFGTQDEAGRNKLVEAITAIQNEFDLILVITHIDDLRDSFPVHIVVDKGGSGSSISIR